MTYPQAKQEKEQKIQYVVWGVDAVYPVDPTPILDTSLYGVKTLIWLVV